MSPTRVAVIGAGSFGRNHLRIYRELSSASPLAVRLVAVVEPNDSARAQAAAQLAQSITPVAVFASLDDLLRSGLAFDAASVCVPTVHHAAVAEHLLSAGIDVLIEKPFAASLGRILAVGHLERFNPAVTAALAQLDRPMFFEAHRLSIFTPRSLDIDVVLDLMIHDLDIVLTLANSEVREVRAVGLPVLSSNTDIANVRVEFASGCVANFTASRVSTEQVRKLRLFQPRQYLSLDFARQELLNIQVADAPQGSSASRSQAALPAIAHPSPGLSLQKLDLPRAEPLRLELEDFLHAVQTRTTPRVSGPAGRAALALALQINATMVEHAHRSGLL